MGQNQAENWCLPQKAGREASKNWGEGSGLGSTADVWFSLAQSASPFLTAKLCARWSKIQTSGPRLLLGSGQQGSGLVCCKSWRLPNASRRVHTSLKPRRLCLLQELLAQSSLFSSAMHRQRDLVGKDTGEGRR